MAEGPDEVTRRVPQDEDTGELPAAAREELRERARNGDEVAAARAEIEQTRAEMTETVDAIQERLTPERLKEQAKARARNAAHSTGSDVLETIRHNPVPVAITVGGLLGLLLLRRLLSRGSDDAVVIDLRRGRIRGASRFRR